ncbi:TonB-dependent receptor domain-containing protein [Tellurirhabdus bombi]|uniref:TonB-dependent receptor domain-containing protein n=1 Tax=Tellurirhabdus bombi TaxID=2907205 RepID=UPI001F286D1D|nr:TonB-dependent receptor [Tellurirhabdus bombi]
MKKNLLLLFLGCSTVALAQTAPVGGNPGNRPAVAIPGTANDNTPRGNGKIVGVLVDSTTKKPVEFATVALISLETNKPIDGTTTDDKGKFALTKVANGNYRVQFSFIGYRLKESGLVKIDRGTDINLGNVQIAPDVKTLKEVTVTGQAAMIEEKVDRLVYNAEKDLTTKGGDATDVMRRVPLLSVDLDGNVTLRGSQNVRVLINNKPSTIIASSVADALKQIPADMIKSVEVITSPSAKYDAEGSAGIINVITKKNNLQGATLSVDVGAGNRGSNLGVNGNLRTGKMGFTLSGFGRANYNIKGTFDNTQTSIRDGATYVTRQTADTKNQFTFGTYQLGWDYDINKNNVVTAGVRYGARNGTNSQYLITTPAAGTPIRDVDIKDLSGTVDVNVDYTRTLKKPQQEFSILTLFSRNNRTNDFVADLLDGNKTIVGRERNDNGSFNQETTIQADYQTPIRANQQLELGGKGIFRQVESTYQYLIAEGANGAYQLNPNRPANMLNYDQNVVASYLSYTYSTKNKYTFKVGGRYEYTMINATFSAEQKIDVPDYGNFVPSVNISKALKGGKMLRLGYNRRLQRPGIQFLNPNVNAANPRNISFGNPYLRPELTDNVELTYSTTIKTLYLNFTGYGRTTNNSIESVRQLIGTDTIQTTFQNIGKQDAYGANVFGNLTLFSKWQIGGGAEAFYAYLSNNGNNGQPRFSNSGMVVSGRLFTSLQLKSGWGFQGFAFSQGRRVQLQGTQGGFTFYSLGVKKDFKNKRGSIGLAGENFVMKAFKIRNELQTPEFTQSSLTRLYNRGVRVNFSYRFGKMGFDQQSRRRKKSVTNDDVKQGESGESKQQ